MTPVIRFYLDFKATLNEKSHNFCYEKNQEGNTTVPLRELWGLGFIGFHNI